MKKENNFYYGLIVFAVVVVAFLLISRFRNDGATKLHNEQFEKYEQLAFEKKYGFDSVNDAVDYLYEYFETHDSTKARKAVYYVYDYVEGISSLMYNSR